MKSISVDVSIVIYLSYDYFLYDTFFHSFSFDLYLSESKCVSCKQDVVRSFKKKNWSYNLYFLIGMFNPYSFNVFNNIIGFMSAILLFVFYMSHFFLFLLPSLWQVDIFVGYLYYLFFLLDYIILTLIWLIFHNGF